MIKYIYIIRAHKTQLVRVTVTVSAVLCLVVWFSLCNTFVITYCFISTNKQNRRDFATYIQPTLS